MGYDILITLITHIKRGFEKIEVKLIMLTQQYSITVFNHIIIMKLNCTKFLLLCSIFGIFCVKTAYADDHDKCNLFCEIFAQLISFIIGLIVRAMMDTCIENENCGSVLGRIVLYLTILTALYVLLYLLLLLCGIDISPPPSNSKSKYRLRTGGFVTGLVLGGRRN